MQQRSPTRQDDALVNDVSRKFGLRIFQRNPYRIDNSSDRLADSLGNFHLGNHYLFGNAIDEVSSLDGKRQSDAIPGDHGCADLMLDALGRRLPYQEIVMATNKGRNGEIGRASCRERVCQYV